MQRPNGAPRKARRTGSGHNTRSLYRLHTRLSMVAGGGTSTSPTCSSSLLLLLLLLSSLTSPSSVQGGHDGGEEAKGNEMRHERAEQQQQQGPQPVERAIGLTRSASRWDTIRTWAKLACMNLRPPDSTERYGRGESSAWEVVKEAASRSFETSKGAVEHAAESAAKVAEKAAHKTKEKAKRTVSKPSGKPDAEL
ncbi:uncharacterized protein LOC135584205 [Musa acuminata AAA Group]|uniref:uncharacterized protein LOC135584205 n=1 Tax=Musa acuminata AAA Group TaxID=214697 RepID=UPI0031CE1782